MNKKTNKTFVSGNRGPNPVERQREAKGILKTGKRDPRVVSHAQSHMPTSPGQRSTTPETDKIGRAHV